MKQDPDYQKRLGDHWIKMGKKPWPIFHTCLKKKIMADQDTRKFAQEILERRKNGKQNDL